MTSETLLHNTQLTVVVKANGILEVIHVWRGHEYHYQNNMHTARMRSVAHSSLHASRQILTSTVNRNYLDQFGRNLKKTFSRRSLQALGLQQTLNSVLHRHHL